jgi:hypothetical protein
MAPEERDSFEDHYFACAECAEEVRSAARFRANAREVLRRPGSLETERRPFFLRWSVPRFVPVLASLALAGVVVYQAGFQIPRLKEQAGYVAKGAVPFTLHEPTRGLPTDRAVRIPPGIPVVDLNIELPLDSHFANYQCVIADSTLKVVAAPRIRAAGRAETISIQLNRSNLPAGRYTIAVRGASDATDASPGQGNVISQYQFILE